MRGTGYTPTISRGRLFGGFVQHTTTRQRRARRALIAQIGIRQFKKLQRKEA